MKFNFYIPIYGIIVYGAYKLGEFEICDRETFLSRIENVQVRDKVAFGEHDKYYLSILVFAKNKQEAQEIAYKKATEFKRLMDFSCGRGNSVPAVNIRQHIASSEKCLVLAEGDLGVDVSWEMNNNFIPVEKNIDVLVSKMLNNKTFYIWELHSKSNRSDKENRILNAILWVGKAHIETDNKIYFLELCFAIESILQVDTDKFINPSITYAISTSCAMIIADRFEDRQLVVKKLKELYRKRSNIAHGKTVEVSNSDCELLFKYVAYLLDDLSNKEKWQKFTSMKELLQEVENQKLGKVD